MPHVSIQVTEISMGPVFCTLVVIEPQVGRWHGSDHYVAFVADYIRNIPADNPIKTAAAIWITEALMRKRGCYDTLKTRTVTYRTITRPGERREITVAGHPLARRNPATAARLR